MTRLQFALTLIVLTLILSVGAKITSAQQPDTVRMQVTPFVDGVVKNGEWLLLRVRVENDGADTTARVAVAVQRSGVGRDVYLERVELPRGARKEVDLYVLPNTFSRQLTVELLPADDETPLVTQNVPVTTLENIAYTIGIVESDAGGEGLERLGSLSLDRPEVRVLSIDPDTLPDRVEGFRSLDAIILRSIDTRTFSAQQWTALTIWVAQGGVLVLGGGAEASQVAAGLPEMLQPVTVETTLTVEDLSALGTFVESPVRVDGPFVVARGDPLPAAGVRVAQNGLPLLVERRINEGAVLWFALDPDLTPFDAWAGTDDLWTRLLNPYAAYASNLPPDVSARRMGDDQIAWALNNLPALDIPSLGLLVPLLALYVAVVGPLNYLILRRRRRLELAWLTIPALTLAFSIGAYGLGLSARGTRAIIHQISIVEPIPETDLAAARTYVGIFSPARRTYRTVFSEPTLVESLSGNRFGAAGTPVGRLTVDQGRPTVIDDLAVDQWSLTGLVGDLVVAERYALTVDLSTETDRISGTVRNEGRVTLEDVALVFGGRVERIGDLSPGASAAVSMSAEPAFNFEPTEFLLFSPTAGRPDRDEEIKRQIASAVVSGPPEWREQSPRNTVELFGWTDEGPVDVELDDADPTVIRTTLVHARLPIETGTTIPIGMVPSRLRTTDAACYGPQLTGGARLDMGPAEFVFYLPAGIIDTGALELLVQVTADRPASTELQMWNVDAERWDRLGEVVLGQAYQADATEHVATDSTVRVRLVDTDVGQSHGCYYVRLGTRIADRPG